MAYFHAAHLTLILLLLPSLTSAQTNETGTLSLQSATETILNKPNLDKVRQFILTGGRTCTYNNMYSDQPCVKTERFSYYLSPDPDPRRWKMRCEPEGDCHSLKIHNNLDHGHDYRKIRFKDKATVTLELNPGEDRKGLKKPTAKMRALPEQAVKELLHLIGQHEKRSQPVK